MASAAAASSSSQTRYDVFLSFRGEDTRNNFTAHLYHALCQKGINTFIDDDKLERGQVISPALVAAIENSMFSIVVLSKIMHSLDGQETEVVPIFYNVDPSDVRRQRGIFGEALAKHEENSENMERVQSWKDALTQVANLSGWDSRNKNEPLLIKEIVTDILNKLLSTSISDTENLVGIDARMQEIEMRLCLGSDDFLMVGIWGMGGIGKTTLARAIYRKITCQFEACWFNRIATKVSCSTIGATKSKYEGTHIYKGRLHSKKVLVVLDNVNDPIILKCLVGNYDWFGRGSRIIITTRDKRLLISHGVLNYYEAQRFNYDEAFEFLTPYSLKHKIPYDDFMEVSKEVIGYAQGLPLALEVLGSFLFSMTKEEWRNQLDKLKSTPNMKIQEVLKVSYDGLDDKEKNIFLDIACFFKGEDKDYVMEILDGCGFFSLSGIRALIDKSLVTISWSNELMMHDLIQEMGREIVRQQSLEEPGKRSRLWFHEDINGVLKKNTATEKIEGIFLNLSHLEEMLYFTTQALAGMNRLRLLKVYNSKNISRNFKDTSNMETCKVPIFYGYSLKSLPNDFNPKNLVELSMPYSRIKQLWKGIKVLANLKFMDLSHSKYLIETPNFRESPNSNGYLLKRLFFLVAPNLKNFLRTLGYFLLFSFLRNLQILSFKGCKGPSSTLWFLPRRSSNSIGSILQPLSGLRSLIRLNLSNCNLSDEPNLSSLGFLSSLEELYLGGNDFVTLPSTISQLSNLTLLGLENCKRLQVLPELPSSIYYICAENCTSLKDVSYQVLKSLLPTGQHQKRKFMVRVVKPDTALAVLEASNSGIRMLDRASYQRINPVVKLGIVLAALKVFIPGSRIPDWIRYQSSGSEVKAELPPNWFNSNFLGFAFSFVTCGHFSCLFTLKADVLFDWTSRDDSSSVDIIIVEMISFKRRLESDHVCLCYVPLPQLRNCSQVTHIKVSFMAVSREVSQPLSLKKSMRRNLVEMVRRRNLELLLSALRIALNQMFSHRNA
ncbi:hypothetical protein AAG906_006585 [Vitis piasezkii]